MTLEEEQARKGRTYKMLLWFGVDLVGECVGLSGGVALANRR